MVEIQDLSHVYMRGTPFETRALNGISLRIGAGESLGVAGPTGSGKSTLMMHLNGLLKPQRGTVTVRGTGPLWRRVGMLFQFPEHQLFEETVGEDVAYGPRNAGLPRREVERRVNSALVKAGLPPETYADRPVHHLSGGEKRRVALAGVLALEPEILVLDEPTAGLDPRQRRELIEKLRQWREELTLVVVSHHMEELAELVDRLVILDQGRVAADGPIRELFQQAELLERYRLDLPPMARLARLLGERGLVLEELPLTVAEAERSLLRRLRGEDGI